MAKKNIFSWRNIIIVILLTPIVFYVIWLETVSYQLNSIKEELRADGKPVTFEDLAEIAAEYDNRENAIGYIIEAGSLEDWPQEPSPPMPTGGMMGMSGGMSMGTPISSVSVEEEKPPIYGYMPKDMFDLSDEEQGNLKKYLEANKAQLEALKNAIEIGWYRANMHWEDGINGIWEGLPDIKQTSKLVQYQAISYVYEGEIDKAVKLLNDWRDMLQSSVENKPYTMIQGLVAVSCRHIVNDTVRWMVKEQKLSNGQLNVLYSQIKPLDNPAFMPGILETESVFGYTWLSDFQAADWYVSSNEIEAKFYAYSGLAKMNAVSYCDIMDRLIEASRKDYYKAQKEFIDINNEVEALNEFIYMPIRDALPATTRAFYLFEKSTVTEEILKIILANEMYKNEYGGYAESLEVLKASKEELVIDDTLKPSGLLEYKTTDEDDEVAEYFIWSKGDKTVRENQEAVDKMIEDGLGTVNDLPEEYDNDYIIYRVR